MPQFEIKARENGPYKVPGVYRYEDAAGTIQTTSGEAMALCRCGQSANKPFCDGAHRKVGFEASEVYLRFISPE